MTAEEIIKALQLQPLPQEGGYFKVSYTADEKLQLPQLPSRYQDPRDLSGAIFYLETAAQFSAMHRLPTDELYYYHYGDPLEMLFLYADGTGERKLLGMQLDQDQIPQIHAPRKCWQGSRPLPGGSHGFTLISTSMAPGFHPSDPEFASATALISQYPQYSELISSLTRDHLINQ